MWYITMTYCKYLRSITKYFSGYSIYGTDTDVLKMFHRIDILKSVKTISNFQISFLWHIVCTCSKLLWSMIKLFQSVFMLYSRKLLITIIFFLFQRYSNYGADMESQLKPSREITQNNEKAKVVTLYEIHHHDLLYISVKYDKNISVDTQVMELAQMC